MLKLKPLHVRKREHRLIVGGGMICCAVVIIYWPQYNEHSTVAGTIINLFWLLVEPES